MLLREDLADLMPMVNEANAISQELDKKVHVDQLVFVFVFFFWHEGL